MMGRGICRRALIAAVPSAVATCALAQSVAPLRIDVLADMSGPYADNTGPGLVVAAQMASEDFGGQLMRPIHLARVKPPEASRNADDPFEVIETVPGEQAWRPASESACPLLRG